MNTGTVILIVLFAFLILIFAPLLTIWALNALFPVLAIPYTLKTWFAIIVVTGLFKSSVTVKKS